MRKRSQRGQNQKIPKRTNESQIERDIEATKKKKKIEKKKKKNKKREGGTLLFLLRDPHWYFILYPLYSIEIIIHAYSYVGTLHTIELGLYIPMMSLLKRALGLIEQAS